MARDDELAFGAVPGSDLDPTTVQAMLQNLFAQQQGGYPKIDVPEMPQMARMPSLPAVQALAAPRAPLVGFSPPEGPHQMVSAGQVPGLSSLSGASAASGLSGTRSGASSSTSSGTSTSDALRNLLGGGGRSPAGSSAAGGSGLANSLISSLIKQGVKNLPDMLANLLAPAAGTVGGGFGYDPLGGNFQDLGPYGTGATANTTSDILRPIYPIETAPQDFPNEWEGLDLTGTEPSSWDLGDLFSGGDTGGGLLEGLGFAGDPEAGLGSFDFGDLLRFAGDPEAGLAGSFGQDAIGSVGDLGGLGLDSLSGLTPYLGAASGLMNLGTGIASGNPAAVVSPIKDLGMSALSMSGLIPSGAMAPIAAGATILTNILMDELADPKGRVSAVQDANYLAGQQLQQGANVLERAPALLHAAQGDLSQMSDDQVFNLFNEARAGMKSYQLAADPLAHQGQRDSGARYSTFSPNLVGMIDRNGPIAAQAAKAFQDELVHRGWKPEDFKVPEVGMPGGNDSPFAPYYGTLYTPGGNAGEYNNPDLSPNQLAQVMNRQADLASGGYEGRSQGIPGGTLFLTPEDWAIWGL